MDIVTALALIVWWGKGDIQDFPYFDKILNVPFSFPCPLFFPQHAHFTRDALVNPALSVASEWWRNAIFRFLLHFVR